MFQLNQVITLNFIKVGLKLSVNQVFFPSNNERKRLTI